MLIVVLVSVLNPIFAGSPNPSDAIAWGKLVMTLAGGWPFSYMVWKR